MLLGEYDHSLDDKNRLAIPAKFREAFADGIVVTRGLDGCLYAYTRADWQRLVDGRLAQLDMLSEAGRLIMRHFFAGATEAELDKQGRGKRIAVDQDPTVRPYFEALEQRLGGVQMRFLRGNFAVVLEQLAGNGVKADAILLDLGVSSMQVDRPERGFSYRVDAPLDMRMDPSTDLSARDLVNESSEQELATIFRRYGEERFARPIARAIVRRRQQQPLE